MIIKSLLELNQQIKVKDLISSTQFVFSTANMVQKMRDDLLYVQTQCEKPFVKQTV